MELSIILSLSITINIYLFVRYRRVLRLSKDITLLNAKRDPHAITILCGQLLFFLKDGGVPEAIKKEFGEVPNLGGFMHAFDALIKKNSANITFREVRRD